MYSQDRDQLQQPRVSQSVCLVIVWDSLRSSGASQSLEQLLWSSRHPNMELMYGDKRVNWVCWSSFTGIQPSVPTATSFASILTYLFKHLELPLVQLGVIKTLSLQLFVSWGGGGDISDSVL